MIRPVASQRALGDLRMAALGDIAAHTREVGPAPRAFPPPDPDPAWHTPGPDAKGDRRP
jgi:hypothetical protein